MARDLAPGRLTVRQRDVLRLLLEGHSNAAIAARLFITVNTLEHHLTSLYARLGVSSRSQAIVHALRHDQPDPPSAPDP